MEVSKQIENLIRSMGELPTIPSVFLTVNKMLSDPRTSAIDVGQVVSSDQVIASKVLKLANSAFYGFTGKVNTVPHAVAVLGFSATKNVVLTTSVLSTLKLKNPVEGFNLAAFWKHSAAVGAIAKLVAKEVYPQRQEEAFIAGLLHDIGKLILAICAPDEFSNCMNYAVSNNKLFVDAEREILGISHAELAGLVNEKWNLPAEIITVVVNHHRKIDLADKFAGIIAVVKIADILARGLQIGHACDFSVPIMEDEEFSFLNLTTSKLDSILSASETIIQSSMDFVNID